MHHEQLCMGMGVTQKLTEWKTTGTQFVTSSPGEGDRVGSASSGSGKAGSLCVSSVVIAVYHRHECCKSCILSLFFVTGFAVAEVSWRTRSIASNDSPCANH